MVTNELRGERVDVVPFSDDPVDLIQNALAPARVREVRLDEETGTATVVVSDFQLSLAIGKEGQNARLAARLTGWRIDIKSETQLAEEEAGYGDQEWAEGEWVEDEIGRDGLEAGRRRRGHVGRGVDPPGRGRRPRRRRPRRPPAGAGTATSGRGVARRATGDVGRPRARRTSAGGRRRRGQQRPRHSTDTDLRRVPDGTPGRRVGPGGAAGRRAAQGGPNGPRPGCVALPGVVGLPGAGGAPAGLRAGIRGHRLTTERHRAAAGGRAGSASRAGCSPMCEDRGLRVTPGPADSTKDTENHLPKKIRVYELAKELGLTNKEGLDLALSLGIGVKSHSSSIEDAQADRVRRKADAEGLRRAVTARGATARRPPPDKRAAGQDHLRRTAATGPPTRRRRRPRPRLISSRPTGSPRATGRRRLRPRPRAPTRQVRRPPPPRRRPRGARAAGPAAPAAAAPAPPHPPATAPAPPRADRGPAARPLRRTASPPRAAAPPAPRAARGQRPPARRPPRPHRPRPAPAPPDARPPSGPHARP